MKRNPQIVLQEKRKALAEQEANLIEVYYMSEAMVCDKYNVDYKDEAIEFIEEDMDSLRNEIARLEEKMLDPDAEVERALYHPAFATEQSFWAYKGC